MPLTTAQVEQAASLIRRSEELERQWKKIVCQRFQPTLIDTEGRSQFSIGQLSKTEMMLMKRAMMEACFQWFVDELNKINDELKAIGVEPRQYLMKGHSEGDEEGEAA